MAVAEPPRAAPTPAAAAADRWPAGRCCLPSPIGVVPCVGTELPVRGDPDAVPGLRWPASGSTSSPAMRPGLARLGRLHGGRRLRRLQLRSARPGPAAARRASSWPASRPRGRRRVRPAEPAHQRLLSRGLDAGGAVLRPVGAHQVRLVLERQRLRRDRRAAACDRRSSTSTSARPLSASRSRSSPS